MKYLRFAILTASVLAAALGLRAQEEAPEATPAEPPAAAPPAAETPAGETPAEAPEQPLPPVDDDVFIPSEEVRPADELTFPVNI
jgi:hypothetical protein